MAIRRLTIFCAAALLTTGAVATATTPESYSDNEAREMSIAPYAGLSNSKQVLTFLSQAENLVYQGDSTFAKMHLNEALSAAARLPSSPNSEKNQQLHRVTLITMMDGTVERQYLDVQPDNIIAPLKLNAKNLPLDSYKITKAEVHYVRADWDKEHLLVSMNKLLRDIEKGKPVSGEFKGLHEHLLTHQKQDISDRRAAQDNIALARALIKAKAYEPAKTAMKTANSHIRNIAEEDSSAPQRLEDIATMRNEMESVNSTIERNEPAAFKELDVKMEKWWNALS